MGKSGGQIGGTTLQDAGRYRAFVSYSHRDAVWGRRIHRALETYRLPRKLIGGETARGIVPRRLSPIFRDREELSAGDDLSQQVRDALSKSDALIVIASPHARASQWVAKEIETFRSLHPDKPVLAALIEGEPQTAFPVALLDGREPIAADFRKGGDGKKLATLKLVAGLTGLGLDTLVQRDAQRQLRRVIAITLGAAVAVLTMAALLVVALRAQAEAERQRAEAEGLVEYMLTDLRDKLKGVGRLDIMTAVNERAMVYYGKQGDLSGLPEDGLNRRARILHAMGEDDEKRGDLPSALAKFTEAHRTTAAVLAKKPNDADAIFAHAQSEFWVGEAAWLKKDRALATRHWTEYLRQAKRLARVQPNDRRAELELGYAHGNLCDLFSHDNFDLSRARTECHQSLDHEYRALTLDPSHSETLTALANRHGWLANVELNSGRYAAALEQRTKERAILDQLSTRDPRNADLLQRTMVSHLGSAAIFRSAKQIPQAIIEYKSALRLAEMVFEKSGDQAPFVQNRLKIRAGLADAQKTAGLPAWRATLADARADLRQLDQLDHDRNFVVAMMPYLESLEKEGSQ